MPVLYEKNSFLYSYDMSLFNDEDYFKSGFPDQNLQRIKHLELRDKYSIEPMDHTSLAATIQYFVDRDCELQTFHLALDEVESDDLVDVEDEEEKHRFLSAVAFSSDVLAALVRLKVLKSLTISLWYSQQRTFVGHEIEGTIRNVFNDHLIKSLASQKNFTVTITEHFDTESLGNENDPKGWDYPYDPDDPDCYVTFYSPSWCLRPQHPNAQTENASA